MAMQPITVRDFRAIPEQEKLEGICAEIDLMADQSEIFSVEFVKKDGTLRKMSVQRAMEKNNVKGTERGLQAAETFRQNNPYMRRVCDIGARKKGDPNPFRTVDASRIVATQVGKVRIIWRDLTVR